MKKAQKSLKFLKISIAFIVLFLIASFYNFYYLLIQLFVYKPITIILIPTWILTILFFFKDKFLGFKVKKQTRQRILFYTIFISFVIFYSVFFSKNAPILAAITPTYTATFYQSGIPSGTTWGVTVGGTRYTNTSSSITVSGLSGTVSYSYDSQVGTYFCISGCSGYVTASSNTASATYSEKCNNNNICDSDENQRGCPTDCKTIVYTPYKYTANYNPMNLTIQFNDSRIYDNELIKLEIYFINSTNTIPWNEPDCPIFGKVFNRDNVTLIPNTRIYYHINVPGLANATTVNTICRVPGFDKLAPGSYIISVKPTIYSPITLSQASTKINIYSNFLEYLLLLIRNIIFGY